jgi:hypothetical protein
MAWNLGAGPETAKFSMRFRQILYYRLWGVLDELHNFYDLTVSSAPAEAILHLACTVPLPELSRQEEVWLRNAEGDGEDDVSAISTDGEDDSVMRSADDMDGTNPGTSETAWTSWNTDSFNQKSAEMVDTHSIDLSNIIFQLDIMRHAIFLDPEHTVQSLISTQRHLTRVRRLHGRLCDAIEEVQEREHERYRRRRAILQSRVGNGKQTSNPEWSAGAHAGSTPLREVISVDEEWPDS